MTRLYRCDCCNKVEPDCVNVRIVYKSKVVGFDTCEDCGKQVLRFFNPGASTFQSMFGVTE